MSVQHDIPARVAGLLVFAAGIALLVFVFVSANTLFNAPPPPIPPTTAAPGAAAPGAFVEIGKSFSVLGRQILLLLLMCIAGSVVASKGIQLYFAARAGNAPTTGAAASASTKPEPATTAANGQNAPSAPDSGLGSGVPPRTGAPKS